MSEKERQMLEDMISVGKHDSAMLAAFEACGRMIDELSAEIVAKDAKILELESKLDDALVKLVEVSKCT